MVSIDSTRPSSRQTSDGPVASDAVVVRLSHGDFKVLWVGAGTARTDWTEEIVNEKDDEAKWLRATGYSWPDRERAKLRAIWPGLDVAAEPERPMAFDIAHDPTAGVARPMLIQDLLGEKGTLFIAAEEGGGKSTAVDQLARELLLGRDAWDFFEPGDIAPQRVLTLHTEMDEPEVREQSAAMERRGLAVPEGSLFAVCAGGLDLARSAEDLSYIEGQIVEVQPDMIVIDSASNAVMRPQEDEDVRAFFNWLQRVHRDFGVRGSVIVGHPRKQGHERSARRFDDLFGSREWKGRVSKALWMDNDRVDVWKDRGGHLGLRLGRRPGRQYPGARLERPGFEDGTVAPFRLSSLPSDKEIAERQEQEVLGFVAAHPGELNKTHVAERLGGRDCPRFG